MMKIKKSKNITHFYITKNGGYYRPNFSGYTTNITRAGIYTKEEAINHYNDCNELTLVPIIIEEHNKRIKDEIIELLDKIISTEN